MNKEALKRRFAILMVFILVALTVTVHGTFRDFAYAKDKKPSIKSSTGILIDAKTGNILWNKKPHKKIYPASTCKVMTAIVALENSNLTDIVTISENALKGQKDGGSHIALDAKERISMENALYAMLLASANECAIAIGETVGGSELKFARMMNKKAKELKLDDSHFTNSYGFYNKDHYSSVHDLAYITRYALSNEDFLKIFSSLKRTIPPSNLKKEKTVIRNNHGMTKYKYNEYPGVIGGKRGYIRKSKFNLITVAKRKDLTLIAVVGRGSSHKKTIADTKLLLDYGFENFISSKISQTEDGKPLSSLLDDSDYLQKRSKLASGKMDLVLRQTVKESPINLEANMDDNLNYPIEKGTVIGQLTAEQGGQPVGSLDIIAAKDINSKLKHKLMLGASILILFILILITTLTLTYLSNKRRKNKKGLS